MDPDKLTEKYHELLTVYLAADKYGLEVQGFVTDWLKEKRINFEVCGDVNESEPVKLEAFIPAVVRKVKEDFIHGRGVLICGTGIGVAIGANRFSGIRAHLAINPESAVWCRQYDDCNILCLKGWSSTREETVAILEAFFNTDYDGNIDRRKMLNTFDSWN